MWDPQASRSNMPVSYSSPALPAWLAWTSDTLSGIPPPDAENCDVTVEARVSAISVVPLSLLGVSWGSHG